jgi:uncharacterized paraquat-inducible protein A
MGRLRPRSALVKRRKDRRCGKCGAKLNNQQVRCKRCASPQPLSR